MSIGKTVSGRYEVFAKLGHGGMGDVYAANDLQLERKVALKAIRAEYRLQAASRARFLREARALSRLEHASICRIHDYVAGEDHDYLVLELIEGESLRERLKSGVDPADALRFAQQIGDALATAHAESLVHRDLKPGNVMVTPQGEAKILDFGLARAVADESEPDDDGASDVAPDIEVNERGETSADTDFTVDPLDRTITSADARPTMASPDSLTEVGSKVGTPRYMSPEQARGEEVGPASDMFAFGLLLHEMFTGKRAYALPAGDELVEAIASGRTERVQGVDRHLADFIERLKSPAASRRPTAVDAVARLRWIRGKPQRRLRWAAMAAMVVIAVGAGIKYTLDLQRERAAAEYRRGQSDKHIEFMVEDLYAKLQPVGRVDILEDVGLKALEYFETLSDAEKTDDDRARLGRTWTQIGHVRISSGEFDAALEAFETSLSIHGELVETNPRVGEWQMGLSGAHFGVANIAWIQGEMDKAATHFEAYRDISHALVEIDADSPAYQLEVGYAYTNMAGLYEATERPELAREQLLRATAVKRRLIEADPGNAEYKASLANTLSWLYKIDQTAEDHEAALSHAEAALELRRAIAEDERDTDAQEHLCISLQQVGKSLEVLGRWDEAERAYREDIAISVRLARLDPDNRRWQFSVAASWSTLGALYLSRQRHDDARPMIENSFDSMKSLVAIQPDERSWRYEFESARRLLAELEMLADAPSEAIRVLDDGPVAEDPSDAVNDSILRGRIRLRLGDRAAAASALGRAERFVDENPSERLSRDLDILRQELAG